MAVTGISKSKTGFVYDRNMEKHKCNWDPMHAERPERTKCVIKRLFNLPVNLTAECHILTARPATQKEISLVHSEALVDDLHRTCTGDAGPNDVNLKKYSEMYHDVYVNKDSENCAAIAAGCTIELLDAIQAGTIRNGLALVRPPGHHASSAESNGFCLYNNVAIGAKYLMNKYPVKRILIVDWDVHHGQGTQRIFFEDERVLYFSIHRYEQGQYWPSLRESDFDVVGHGKGRYYTINVPLNKTGLGDAEYMAIFQQVLLPVAYEFDPEMVIISAGYDAAVGCPEGRMNVTPAMYGHLTHALCGLAHGKVAVVLEGGYCLDSLSEGIVCTLEALRGLPCHPLEPLPPPDPSVVESIVNVISVHRQHWRCFRFQDAKASSYTKGLPHYVPRAIYDPPPDGYVNQAYGFTDLYSAEERVYWRDVIASLRKTYDKFRTNRLPENKTCYTYSEIMEDHIKDLNHVGCWDKPERIVLIRQRLQDRGLLKDCSFVPGYSMDFENLSLVHSPDYAEVLCEKHAPLEEILKLRNCSELPKDIRWPPDIFASKNSGSAIRMAAGSLLAVTEEVLTGKATNGFAIIRPPGHHAHSHYPAGFSFANNVALTAKVLLEKRSVQRILIVDFDMHHGDGIQEAFYSDPRVLFISMHLGGKDFYPKGDQKNVSRVGEERGTGYNVNLPWTKHGLTDGDYIAAFLQLVMPVAYEYAPEIVLVCCGFDPADGDGFAYLSPFGFWTMVRMLTSLAGGKVVLALEGGYKPAVVEECGEAVMRALKGLPCQCGPTRPLVPSDSAARDIRNCLNTHRKYWKSLQYRAVLSNPDGSGAGIKRTGTADPVEVSPKKSVKLTLKIPKRTKENQPASPKKQRS